MHGVGGDDPPIEMWEPSVRALSKADPTMAKVIRKLGGRPPSVKIVRDPFEALVRGICHQNLAASTSSTIVENLRKLGGDRFPGPSVLRTLAPSKLRKAGLSRNQIKAIRELAARVMDRDVDLAGLAQKTDEAVISELVSLRGIGEWTAKMFLVFHLGRPDVLMTNDKSLRNAIASAFDLDEPPDNEAIEQMAEMWRPWRSAAAFFLWRVHGGITPGLD
jgi:DNA-3-methyladenine glycosylase II